jgi:hypothetical protein
LNPSQVKVESPQCFQKCYINSGRGWLNNDLPEIVRGSLDTYLHSPLGADEIGEKSWQLVTAIHDKGDGLTLFDH